MDAFGGVVRDKLGGGVIGVELDLVDSRDDLQKGQSAHALQVLNYICSTFVDGSLRSFSKFLMPKFETPIALTLPVAGNFCISCHVFMKFQSG